MVKGRPSDTLQYHRRQLLNLVHGWVLPSEKAPDPYDPKYRDRLLKLLVANSYKHRSREIPAEGSEWIKLVNEWVKGNSADDTVFERKIFYILAVDGFTGIGAKDLKFYLQNVLIPLSDEYKMHARGVRAMYNYFQGNMLIESLTGTDSACIVFLALLTLYMTHLQSELFDEKVDRKSVV